MPEVSMLRILLATILAGSLFIPPAAAAVRRPVRQTAPEPFDAFQHNLVSRWQPINQGDETNASRKGTGRRGGRQVPKPGEALELPQICKTEEC